MPPLYSETPFSPFSTQKGNFDGPGNQCNTLRSTQPVSPLAPRDRPLDSGFCDDLLTQRKWPQLDSPPGWCGWVKQKGGCSRLQSQNGHVFNVSLWNIHLVLKHKLWICRRFTLKHPSPLFLRKRATSMGQGTSATPLDQHNR